MKKKLISLLCILAMLTSVGAIFVSAYSVPGTYVTSAETFEPVGDVAIPWDEDARSKLDLTDGDLADWAEAGYSAVEITPENMVSWVDEGLRYGDESSMPEGWKITAYFAADKDYLYTAFRVVDHDVLVAANPGIYDGDAIQLGIDFDYALGKAYQQDPDLFGNPQSVFYCFSPLDDEASPIQITVQNTEDMPGGLRDGVRTETEKPEGYDPDYAIDTGEFWYDVQGSTNVTEDGWLAEFRMSWQDMYDDFEWRSWSEGANIYVGENAPLDVSCLLTYLNRSQESTQVRAVNWAAATLTSIPDGQEPIFTWGPADHGMNAYLEWFEGMEFTCPNIKTLYGDFPEDTDAWVETEAVAETETVAAETEVPETNAPETEAATDAPVDPETTEADTEAETKTYEAATQAETLPVTEAETETETEAPTEVITQAQTNAPADPTETKEKIEISVGGCGGVIGGGMAGLMLLLCGATVLLRKREE